MGTLISETVRDSERLSHSTKAIQETGPELGADWFQGQG